MTENHGISKGRMFWEMFNPALFFLLCMFLCTLLVQMIYTSIALQNKDILGIYQSATQSALAAGIVYYSVTIFLKRKTVIYDKFKYGHKSEKLPIPFLVLYGAGIYGVALIADRLIEISGLTNIFSGYDTAVGMTMTGQSPIVMILAVVILGPIAEEIIFRWMIFGRVRFYLGKKRAIIISSLLFALFHGNMIQFIFCTVVGIALAFVYDRTGNIYLCVIAHMAINFTGVIPFLQI